MLVADAAVVDDAVAEDTDALIAASDAVVLFSGPLDPPYMFSSVPTTAPFSATPTYFNY